MNPIVDGRVVASAITLALGLAIMGAVLGARLHSTRGFAGEGGQPVYPAYGWPWGWKTNAPAWLIEQADDNRSDSALADQTAYPEHGIRGFVLLGITTMWFPGRPHSRERPLVAGAPSAAALAQKHRGRRKQCPMTTGSPQPISYVLVVVAIVLAAGLAVTGTVLGALVYSSRGLSGEGGRPVYSEYGWPLDWKTNAPAELIVNSNDDGGYPYGRDGYAPVRFMETTIMWFLAALTAEALLWAVVHYLRRLLRNIAGSLGRPSRSPGLPP